MRPVRSSCGPTEAFDRVRRAAVGERQVLTVGFLAVGRQLRRAAARASVRRRHPEHCPVDRGSPDRGARRWVAERPARCGTHPPAARRRPGTEVVLSEPVAAVLPSGHRLAGAEISRLADLAAESWVLTPRSSWEPWHQKYDQDFAAAGFTPLIAQRGTSVQSLLALVAAGVGVTRLPLSARSLRDTGVAFVPLRGESADVVVAWIDDRPRAEVEAFRDVVRSVARTSDLLASG